MERRHVVTGALALAVAVVVGFAVTAGSGNDDGDASPSSAKVGSNGAAAGSDKGSAEKSKDSKNTGKVTNGKSSEVIEHPEGSGKNGLPGLSKSKQTKTRYLVTRPLPKTSASLGKVVGGFPLAVVPVMSGSAVRSTSVSSTAKTLQVSLEAKSTRSADKILAYYRAALTRHGFEESKVQAVGSAKAATFAHHTDYLIITVTKSRSKGSTYTVFGTLHAGKSK